MKNYKHWIQNENTNEIQTLKMKILNTNSVFFLVLKNSHCTVSESLIIWLYSEYEKSVVKGGFWILRSLKLLRCWVIILQKPAMPLPTVDYIMI